MVSIGGMRGKNFFSSGEKNKKAANPQVVECPFSEEEIKENPLCPFLEEGGEKAIRVSADEEKGRYEQRCIGEGYEKTLEQMRREDCARGGRGSHISHCREKMAAILGGECRVSARKRGLKWWINEDGATCSEERIADARPLSQEEISGVTEIRDHTSFLAERTGQDFRQQKRDCLQSFRKMKTACKKSPGWKSAKLELRRTIGLEWRNERKRFLWQWRKNKKASDPQIVKCPFLEKFNVDLLCPFLEEDGDDDLSSVARGPSSKSEDEESKGISSDENPPSPVANGASGGGYRSSTNGALGISVVGPYGGGGKLTKTESTGDATPVTPPERMLVQKGQEPGEVSNVVPIDVARPRTPSSKRSKDSKKISNDENPSSPVANGASGGGYYSSTNGALGISVVGPYGRGDKLTETGSTEDAPPPSPASGAGSAGYGGPPSNGTQRISVVGLYGRDGEDDKTALELPAINEKKYNDIMKKKASCLGNTSSDISSLYDALARVISDLRCDKKISSIKTERNRPHSGLRVCPIDIDPESSDVGKGTVTLFLDNSKKKELTWNVNHPGKMTVRNWLLDYRGSGKHRGFLQQDGFKEICK